MSIVLLGSTSGSITLQEPAVAGNTTINLPASSGTVVVGSSAVSAAGQIPFSTDGSTYTPTAKIVSGTAVASTSGTSIDFTSIPSWVKRITVMFRGVSTSGTASIQVQLGTGAGPTFTTSGYVSGCSTSSATASTNTTGLIVVNSVAAAEVFSGSVSLTNITGTNWTSSSVICNTGTGNTRIGGGYLDIGATLTAVRITTTGTDTFDAGTINILYE